MKNQTRDELIKIMDAFDRRREEAEHGRTDREKRESAFAAAFDQLVREVILPVVQEVGQVIAPRGHLLELTLPGTSGASQRQMTLTVELVRATRASDYPYYEFTASPASLKVKLHSVSLNEAGIHRELKIEQVTRGLVEHELMEWLRRSL